MSERSLLENYLRLRVRRLRLAKGFRSQELAQRAGIRFSTYSCLENGGMRFGVEQLFRVLAALGAPIDEVWPRLPSGGVDSVTERFIRKVVESQPPPAPLGPSLDEVVSAVADRYQVTALELRSTASRSHRLAEARAMSAFLVRDIPHLTLSALSRCFGCDPSSLSHGMKRLEGRLPKDPALRAKIVELKTDLDPPHAE